MMQNSRTGYSIHHIIWLILIFFAALFLRLWQIDSIPAGFHFDESFEGLEAWHILIDPTYRPIFLTGNFGVPPLNSYTNALTFQLFILFGGEAGPTAMRTTAALIGAITMLLIFALADELRHFDDQQRLSPAFPLFAALSLALMRWHIHFSRMGIEPVWVPLVWCGATWLTLRAWRTRRLLPAIGSGLFLAAGMYAYQGAWIIPFLMVPIATWLFLTHRMSLPSDHSSDVSISQHPLSPSHTPLSTLFITAIVAFILVTPLVWFFAQNIDLVFLRPTQLAIVGETGSPADSNIWTSSWATLKMFGPFGAPGDLDPRRNIPGAPALNLWQVIPFYLGLLLALVRIRTLTYFVPLLGLVGLVMLGIISEYAPHFHRILGASAPTALLCAIGLDWLWSASGHFDAKLRSLRFLGPMLVITFLLAGGVTSYTNYFNRWANLSDHFYAFDVGLWKIGQWMAEQPTETPIYLTPRTAEHATIAFALKARSDPHPTPISFDGRHVFPMTAKKNSEPEAYVAIEHEDFRTPLLMPGELPDANIEREFLDLDGDIYARIYRRPLGVAPARQPTIPLDVNMSNAIGLVGYDLQPSDVAPGNILYLQLHWLVRDTIMDDWTVFTHLVNDDGELVTGFDSPPGLNSLPTDRWKPGWRILDEYQLSLPTDLPPGEYTIQTGMYQVNGPTLPSDGEPVILGTILIE